MIGRIVHLVADLQTVVVTCAGVEVARHDRCWADRQTLTDPDHHAAAVALRHARRLVAVPKTDTSVEHRDLADYDRMFGLTDTSQEIA